MRLLFVKADLAWPRTSGHDVHSYYMMRSIQRLGHEVGLVTRTPCVPQATAGMDLVLQSTLGAASPAGRKVRLGRMQERFRSYWGLPVAELESVAAIVDSFQPDVLVAVGLEALPFMAASGDARAVWYAADEWFLHHMTLVKVRDPASWVHVRPAAIKLLYERAFSKLIDRAWVVSEADRRSMRWCAGIRSDVLPNGVDADFFAPQEMETVARSCVFWGRLDFEPNIQGLQWFMREAWPRVREMHPDAMLRVIGANPVRAVLALGATPGVSLHPNVPDLRALLHDMQVAIMPFVSGGGIKNKILEAAANARPVVCTPRALGGLKGAPPFVAARSGVDWARQLSRLWSEPGLRASLGQEGRNWVIEHHSWEATASAAIGALRT